MAHSTHREDHPAGTSTDAAPSVVVAGGGTAGHIEPALAVAEAVNRLAPNARITALGSAKGLEASIVPERGFGLRTLPPVPVARSVNTGRLTLPRRREQGVGEAKAPFRDVQADVLIGCGGYVCAPAYRAARALGIPFFVHEANARL